MEFKLNKGIPFGKFLTFYGRTYPDVAEPITIEPEVLPETKPAPTTTPRPEPSPWVFPHKFPSVNPTPKGNGSFF